MKLTKAIEILEYHQQWMLGQKREMIYQPEEITMAVNVVTAFNTKLSEVKENTAKSKDVIDKNNTIPTTYEEAMELCLTVPWKITKCNQGESCWCRMIEPVEEIKYMSAISEDTETIYIARSGSLEKKIAEHMVKLHNDSLKKIGD